MKVIPFSYPFEFARTEMPARQAAAIGHFDGVHLGHQEVIRRAVDSAKSLGLPASIITFSPHPREFLGKSTYRQTLTPLEDKFDLFRQLGIDYTYVVNFDLAFSQLTPEQFVNELLLPMGMKSLVVGFDFAFGHRASGNPDILAALGQGTFTVEVVPPFHLGGKKVSSTWIRERLLEGDQLEANRLLGRPYSISGVVVHGDARGRQIGFPTANLQLTSPYVVPGNGVYAVKVSSEGLEADGVMNIGVRPTFTGGTETRLEAHLFDFDGDLYGQTLKVEFLDFIRPERKFASVDELVRQIGEDAEQAKILLGSLK